MIDYIKIQNVSVLAGALVANSSLDFKGEYSQTTGEVINYPLSAADRGLTFMLMPTKSGDRIRCELQGSLHYYHNDGFHNADNFTAADLLATLDQLVTTYGIDPFRSQLNNVEFGVNIRLPFPVRRVLNNLISYKNRPFTKEPGGGFDYYQCHTQRYIVKLYDKGDQYGLPDNVLRVEIKVLKMEYLNRLGLHLNVLVDLLNVANYGPLGALLVQTFTDILFDEPTINPAALTIRERDIYQNGRNPKFWENGQEQLKRFKGQKLDVDQRKRYDAERQRLHTHEKVFRALLNRHRQGDDWQGLTAMLISQTWEKLTRIDDDLLRQINNRRAVWQGVVEHTDTPEKCHKLTRISESDIGRGTVEKCHKLTGFNDDLPRGEMSQINPLSIALICDIDATPLIDLNLERGTHPAAAAIPQFATVGIPNAVDNSLSRAGVAAVVVAAVDGAELVRPTASMLRADAGLLAKVEQGRKRYAKGSKEDQPSRAAHNLRNDDSNPRNNLSRRLRRLTDAPAGGPLPLFSPAEVVRLTVEQQVVLDRWQGTRYEVRL